MARARKNPSATPRRAKRSVNKSKPDRESSLKPSAIGSILDSMRKTSELGLRFQQAEIWNRWPEIAGPYLAAHGFPKLIKGNVLYIEADSTVWMNKFAYQKWDLLKRISRIAGKELVSDVFILLKGDSEPAAPQGSG